MSLRAFSIVALGAALLLLPVAVRAHHSFSAEFDAQKTIAITGTVSRMEWTNPHAHLYIDVKDERGKLVEWWFELGSPNSLLRSGWTRNSAKPGEIVTVKVYLARSGGRRAKARSVTLRDGRKVSAGSSNDSEPTQ